MEYRVRLTKSERKSAQKTTDLTRLCSMPAAGNRGYGDSSRAASKTIKPELSQTGTQTNISLRRTSPKHHIKSYGAAQVYSDMPAPIEECTIQEFGSRIWSSLAGLVQFLTHYLKAKHIEELYKPYKE